MRIQYKKQAALSKFAEVPDNADLKLAIRIIRDNFNMIQQILNDMRNRIDNIQG